MGAPPGLPDGLRVGHNAEPTVCGVTWPPACSSLCAWPGARGDLECKGGGRRKKSSSHCQEMAGLQVINLLPSQLPGPQEFIYYYSIYYHYFLFYILFHLIPTTTVFSFHGQPRLRNNKESPGHVCQTPRPMLSITRGIFLVTNNNIIIIIKPPMFI